MSNTQYAFIQRSSVPGRGALQASIDGLGFDLKFHLEFDLTSDSGFLPLVLNGQDGLGFEVLGTSTAEMAELGDELLSLAGERDYCISMVWGSSMKDLACVMILSCALTKDFGAVVSYEGSPPESLATMLESTRDILKDADG